MQSLEKAAAPYFQTQQQEAKENMYCVYALYGFDTESATNLRLRKERSLAEEELNRKKVSRNQPLWMQGSDCNGMWMKFFV